MRIYKLRSIICYHIFHEETWGKRRKVHVIVYINKKKFMVYNAQDHTRNVIKGR